MPQAACRAKPILPKSRNFLNSQLLEHKLERLCLIARDIGQNLRHRFRLIPCPCFYHPRKPGDPARWRQPRVWRRYRYDWGRGILLLFVKQSLQMDNAALDPRIGKRVTYLLRLTASADKIRPSKFGELLAQRRLSNPRSLGDLADIAFPSQEAGKDHQAQRLGEYLELLSCSPRCFAIFVERCHASST